nr:unnamed protein product [Digitaria exilis]
MPVVDADWTDGASELTRKICATKEAHLGEELFSDLALMAPAQKGRTRIATTTPRRRWWPARRRLVEQEQGHDLAPATSVVYASPTFATDPDVASPPHDADAATTNSSARERGDAREVHGEAWRQRQLQRR